MAVVSLVPMAKWNDLLRCDRCESPLEQPGGLFFTPPDINNNVRKFHVCAPCSDALVEGFEQITFAQGEPITGR